MTVALGDRYPDATCDLCGGGDLRAVYRASNSRRGLTVCVCLACGLIQSLPRLGRVADRTARVSSGADWGNIRYGKGFRVAPALEALAPHVDFERPLRMLDVGANRGGFCLAFAERCRGARILAIEPDASVIADYADHPAITVDVRRVEHADLAPDAHDVIHCSHTLEHLEDPLRQLTRMAGSLAADGVMYLEVPNSRILDRGDLIEEWFIDKHLFHFSRATFLDLIRRSGLAVVAGTLLDVDDFLGAVVRRDPDPASAPLETDDPTAVEARVRAYGDRLARNINDLKSAARAIARLRPKRVVFWGAGRIFQSFMQAGGFEPDAAVGVIDRELWRYVDEMAGMKVSRPDDIEALAPDVVIVMSRQFYDEIKAAVEATSVNCEVRAFSDFMTPA